MKNPMLPPQIGERIRTARLLNGATQKELADASGLSQALISQMEAGLRVATEESLIAVQRALDMPRAFFFIEPQHVPAGTLRFRKSSSSRIGDTRRIEELVREAWQLFSVLMEERNYPVPRLPQPRGHENADIDALALETRAALGVSDDRPIPHMTRLLEAHGFVVINLASDQRDDSSDLVGHFGASCWPSPMNYGVIGVFPSSGDRERFTLAHELGHLVLHRSGTAAGVHEKEANDFAGSFLLPATRMTEALSNSVTLIDLAALKARWGVSIQALIMRGSSLGLIDEARKTSLYKQLSARGWRTSEPVEVHREEPRLAWELLRQKFGEKPYSKAEDELGMRQFILRGWAPRPTGRGTTK